MKKFEATPMMIRYLVKFVFRIAIFGIVFYFYLTDRETLSSLLFEPFWKGISPVHLLWALFMAIMLFHIFPANFLSMALRKSREEEYVSAAPYSELDLLRFVQLQNVRAWRVMLVWLCFNAVFGILYLVHVIEAGDLLMLTVFYFLSDYICILLFCPFQTFLMKSKCCISCRIYDWGHFMMFTPMLFIRNFYSWSLFFTSIVVLISWEIRYSRHPERFWEKSNKNLQCANCKDKTCQLKRRIGKILPF